MADIETIKEKLARLKKIDSDLLIFGADSHKYNLNPVLSEDEVSAFEQRHNIHLPEEYRLFITQIGDGGAGPFYGLLSLYNNGDGSGEDDLQTPFPFSAEYPFNLDALFHNLRILYNDPNDPNNENAILAQFNKKIVSESYSKVNRGVTYICHEGCGMYSVLVANGAEYGNVWFVDITNGLGAFPISDPATRKPVGFFRWYELWLDYALAECSKGNRSLDEGVFSYMNYVTQLQSMYE